MKVSAMAYSIWSLEKTNTSVTLRPLLSLSYNRNPELRWEQEQRRSFIFYHQWAERCFPFWAHVIHSKILASTTPQQAWKQWSFLLRSVPVIWDISYVYSLPSCKPQSHLDSTTLSRPKRLTCHQILPLNLGICPLLSLLATALIQHSGILLMHLQEIHFCSPWLYPSSIWLLLGTHQLQHILPR